MPGKDKAKEELKRLIKRYHDQRAEIVNEQQVCDSLVRPFFNKVLGWDTEDPSEFRSQFTQRGKRIDYLAFLNGISQFIIEVKELNHEIRHNFQDYEQALNYAKNKDKPFAILTNFSQFIILRADTEAAPLQCEVRAINIEKAVDSETDFDILWNFQKEVWAAEKGDALYKLKPGKKSLPVDKRLVDDLKKWRLALLTNLKKHPKLNDFADFEKEMPYIEQEVQRFIDRLIFICYCEDKELKEKELKNLLETKESDYSGKEAFLVKETKELFDDYRRQYDSDLFFEQGYCDKFRFEDTVLAEILRDLRKPFKKVPYDFSAIESDVLGKAYENFIGHVVTGAKRFKEKESISKRKEEGVYYTPQYIVNYIVDNTLRSYIKENGIGSFGSLLKIRVLDPACGSGTFLIRAFEVLEEEARKILGRETNYDENVKLLTSCIFGVDKDERAVDIAKLRLSLTLAARQKLPELGKNVQCGDSLIDDYSIAGEKAFNWQERFKDVMQNGGFDVVVGNPPYIPIENFSEKDKKYYFLQYRTPYRKFDSSILFIEKAVTSLKKGGFLGYIVPLTWQTGENYFKFRTTIFSFCDLKNIINLPFDVFQDAYVDTGLFILQKGKVKSNEFLAHSYDKKNHLQNIDNSNFDKIKQQCVDKDPFKRVFTNKLSYTLSNKLMEDSALLGEITDSCQGIVVSKFPIKDSALTPSYKKLLTKGEGNRYSLKIFETKHIDYSKATNLYRFYSEPRIFVRRLINRQNRLMAFYYETPLITKKDFNPFILTNKEYPLKYLLGLLNSKLISYFYINASTLALKDDFRQTTLSELRKLPIKKTTMVNKERFASLVDKILSLHKRLSELGDKHTVERERIEAEIKKTDTEIDELVYQLYGITDEEKRIIEESLK